MSAEQELPVRDALERLTTSIPDTETTLYHLHERTDRAYRRRRISGLAATITLAAAIGFGLAWRPSPPDAPFSDDRTVPTAISTAPTGTHTDAATPPLPPPSTPPTSTAPAAAGDTAASSAPSSTPAASELPPTSGAPATTSRPRPRPTTPPVAVPVTAAPTTFPAPPSTLSPPTTPPVTAAPTTPPSTTPPTAASTTVPSTTAPPTTAAPTTTLAPPAPIRKTRTTSAGAVTAESVGANQLTVIDTAPYEGFTAEVRQRTGASILVELRSTDWVYLVSAIFDGTRITFSVAKEYIGPPTTPAG